MKTSLFHHHPTKRRGLTLVELLVVISIMVTLVAVSIPVFKPMLESQRTAGAARVVAGALQRARIKAMQDRTAYGLRFVRFVEGNAPDVSVQLRLQRPLAPFVSPEALRVIVKEGQIKVCALVDDPNPDPDDDAGKVWSWDAADSETNQQIWNSNVKAGQKIQFGRQGRVYTLETAEQLAEPYNDLTLPNQDYTDENGADREYAACAMEATVTRLAVPTLSPQIVLPRGTVVDLRYSGTQSDSGTAFTGTGVVSVQFSPGGHVDGFTFEKEAGQGAVPQKTNDIIYFCVGEWERQGLDDKGGTYAEDGRSNAVMPSNYWVTVSPKNGQVRITEFAAPTSSKVKEWQESGSNENLQEVLKEVRKFATESAMNVGGF